MVTAGSQHCGLPPQVLHFGASAGLAAAAGAGLSARADPTGRRYAPATPRVELSASRVRIRRGEECDAEGCDDEGCDDEGCDDEGCDDDVERDRDVGM